VSDGAAGGEAHTREQHYFGGDQPVAPHLACGSKRGRHVEFKADQHRRGAAGVGGPGCDALDVGWRVRDIGAG
jgi:hypothetical protein